MEESNTTAKAGEEFRIYTKSPMILKLIAEAIGQATKEEAIRKRQKEEDTAISKAQKIIDSSITFDSIEIDGVRV